MKKAFYLLLVTCFSLSLAAQEKQEEKAGARQLKPALLVIDIQNKFLQSMSEKDQKVAPEYINGAIWLFRKHHFPVIRIHHTDPGWGPEPGTEDFAFPKTIITEDSDPMVIKNYPSGFTKTNLDSILQANGINTLFLCGLSATHCVLATYWGGIDKGYETFMLKNALLSQDTELTSAVEEFTGSVSWSTLKLILETAE
jgi:nicotinamidase-related amidase